MDSNSLNKTATGISIIQNASTQRQELIARMLAEGMKGIFRKMLGLVMRHVDKAQVIRLRGKWVEMNPKDWKEGYDMSVAVGLGTGNREQMAAHLTSLMEIQQRIAEAQGGLEGPLIRWKHVYETAKRYTESLGLKGTENYFEDPAAEEGQPQQDPGADQKAQQDAAMQAEAQKFQAETKRDMDKAHLDSRTKIEIARIGAVKDLIIAGVQQAEALLDVSLAAEGGQEMPSDAQQAPDEPEMPMMPEQAPEQPYMPVNEPVPQGDDIHADPNMPIDPGMMS